MTEMVFVSKGRVKLICPQCGKEFVTFLSVAKRPGTHCCCFACEVKLHPRKPRKRVDVTCKHCGKIFEVAVGYSKRASYCSNTCKNAHQVGVNASNYKHGLGHERGKSRNVINARVKEEGKCQRCGARGTLHGHHIKSYAEHPELRNDPSNIEVLCGPCHASEHPHQANMLLRPVRYSGRMKPCEVCGTEFYVKPSHEKHERRFCSVACRRTRPHRVLTAHVKACAVCGNEFVSSKSYAMYCSKACNSRASYARKKPPPIIF